MLAIQNRVAYMDIHEFQAKEVLKKYTSFIPPYGVASNLSEVKQIIYDLNLQKAVLKVQVHSGGRAKAGGVCIASTRQDILHSAKKMLGMEIQTKQSGQYKLKVEKILITPFLDIDQEYYLSITVCLKEACMLLMLSKQGGVDIEKIAEKQSENLLKIPLRYANTIQAFQLRKVCNFLGWEGDLARQGSEIIKGLSQAFIDLDASLLEINPLVKSRSNQLFLLDTKMSVDDHALFRQEMLSTYYDPSQSSPLEEKAKKQQLSYIALDGNIACMVNGAGLAMATMDIIQYYGQRPANFLDVGGGASFEKVAAAFDIILLDPKVEAILINIFGGIMDCSVLAKGILQALDKRKLSVPLVVRMEGTGSQEGKKMLHQAPLQVIAADSLQQAVQRVLESLEKNKSN